ncbi:MAG: hypothetical protein INF50_11785 [Rhodobacter sp.]|nr:hypothetical protein [Rhodobacter sp.]
MTKETVTSAADIGLPQRLASYLTMFQNDALQLEKMLEAANALAADERRSDLTLEIIAGALDIAKELQVALDTVTIHENLSLIAGEE